MAFETTASLMDLRALPGEDLSQAFRFPAPLVQLLAIPGGDRPAGPAYADICSDYQPVWLTIAGTRK